MWNECNLHSWALQLGSVAERSGQAAISQFAIHNWKLLLNMTRTQHLCLFSYCVTFRVSKPKQFSIDSRKLPKLLEWGCEQSADDVGRGEAVNLFLCNTGGGPQRRD